VGDDPGDSGTRRPQRAEHYLASVLRKRSFRSRTELAAAFARAAEQR
jgi:hypothetical protein